MHFFLKVWVFIFYFLFFIFNCIIQIPTTHTHRKKPASIQGFYILGFLDQKFDFNFIRKMEAQYISKYHEHQLSEHQCSSFVVKHIKAPVDIVWSLVRRFDQPQSYKPFVSRCTVQGGDLQIGSVRQVNIKSGLPATTSTERLELLDDQKHILGVKFVGGDHRLKNYSSIITVHPEIMEGRQGTVVIESFVVDAPEGNTKDDTCYFVRALISCNLNSLADVSERMMAMRGQFDQVNRLRSVESI
ncbi:hypothetical protein ABFS82_02G173300 [Erythranthe guttata]